MNCLTLQLFTIHFKVQMSIEVYFNTGKDNNKTHVIYNLILLTLFYRRAIPLHFHLSSEEPIWHQQNA